MYVYQPTLNVPLIVRDNQSGVEYKITVYYRKGQNIPSLAFDVPKDIEVIDTATKAKSKREQFDEKKKTE